MSAAADTPDPERYLADAIPTLLVWGDRDATIPVAHAHRAHAAMPGSQLEIFKGAGHFPHHVDPERFLSLVLDFIATTEPLDHDRDRWRERLRQGAGWSPQEESLELIS